MGLLAIKLEPDRGYGGLTGIIDTRSHEQVTSANRQPSRHRADLATCDGGIPDNPEPGLAHAAHTESSASCVAAPRASRLSGQSGTFSRTSTQLPRRRVNGREMATASQSGLRHLSSGCTAGRALDQRLRRGGRPKLESATNVRALPLRSFPRVFLGRPSCRRRLARFARDREPSRESPSLLRPCRRRFHSAGAPTSLDLFSRDSESAGARRHAAKADIPAQCG
jgi:hypothetical protein